jgi:hypothetical protein
VGTGFDTLAEIETALGTKAAASHTHNADDINAGTLADARLPARLGAEPKTVTDWNDAIENGFYWATNTASNAPEASWFYGWAVNDGSANWAAQTLVRVDNGKRFTRRKHSGTWGSWVQMTDADGAPLGGTDWTYLSASLTGTAVSITGLPSGVSDLVVILDGASLNSPDYLVMQLGDAGALRLPAI